MKEEGYQVVYFAADSEDIQVEDTEYSDIILACVKQLVKKLNAQDKTIKEKFLKWGKKFIQSLKDVGLTEINIGDINYESPESILGKISTTIKINPGKRQKIRRQVERDAESLIDIFNDSIKMALGNKNTDELVLIVDNLDRIIETFDPDTKKSNYEQIWINYSDQLKKLDCHLIYTVPISIVYSPQATSLEERYKPVQILPMIMVKTPDNKPYQDGINKLKDMILKRVQFADKNLKLEQVFKSTESLEQLCLMSGGHVRNLMALMKVTLQQTDELPITERSVKRAISEQRQTYKNIIRENEWELLANVSKNKRIVNDEAHQQLLFSRCILEYRLIEDDGEAETWHDVNPLILGLDRLQNAIKSLENKEKSDQTSKE